MHEELKIIADMLNGLGSEARNAFVWYLVISRIPTLIGYGVLVFAITVASRIIRHAVEKAWEDAKIVTELKRQHQEIANEKWEREKSQ